MQFVPLTFCPDLDTNWNTTPGAIKRMYAFAPLMLGGYGSIGSANYFGASTLTGDDILTSYAFRQISGAVRLLVFRTTNIDEYDSAATRTNRATGLTTASEWSATAWGNQIIAVSKANATQSSTGAGFTALGGSSPKARHIASNLSFVMMADVDDSGSNVYQDMVWWCALQNPASWTPSIATQAGNQRLLDAPGPITALISYQDTFVAFKDNAMFIGQYVGPQQFIFNWRMISNRVGCVGPKAVVELDGKLYFLHQSGFYEFDGANIRNVGLPVFQNFMSEQGAITGGDFENPTASTTPMALSTVKVAADDVDGVVWFKSSQFLSSGPYYYEFLYGYNARTGKWGRHYYYTGAIAGTTTNIYQPDFVRATTSDMQSFKADTNGRFWSIIGGTSTVLTSFKYPYASISSARASFTTGIIGGNDVANTSNRIYLRHLYGSTAFSSASFDSAVVYVYQNEDLLTLQSTTSLVANSEFNALDGMRDSRYKQVAVNYTNNIKTIIAGIAVEAKRSGTR